MLDSDGYPTEEALAAIKDATTPAGALDAARAAWHWPSMVTEELSPAEMELVSANLDHGRYLRFATGGWSGNESVISALKGSIMGAFCWQLSARGGLHIFKYPQFKEENEA